MVIDLILLILGILGLIIASLVDLKKREVPDSISIGLIIIALALKTLQSIIYSDLSFIKLSLFWLLIFYAFGALMFYTKQWGGGDSKMIMALAATFPTAPIFLNPLTGNIPFPITLLFNILIIGSIYGLLWTLFLMIKHFQKFKKQFIPSSKKINIFALFILVIGILSVFIIQKESIKLVIILLTFLIIIYPYLYITIKIVEKIAFYKIIPVEKLTPGDWIAKDIIKENKVIYSSKSYGIEEKDIKRLIKLKIEKVNIKEGIPFVPSFLIGTLISLFIGNIIFLII